MPYLNLSSDDYKRRFLTGFAHLQEEQDFVDLTVAVDGHFVKVHKNVMALASPYLRDIMKKSPSENLVIYLNNVNYKVFSFLLEYIYQGEVNIPEDKLQCFMQLAQSLHVTGIAESGSSEVKCQNKEPDTYPKSNEPPPDISDFNYQENNSSVSEIAGVAVNAVHNYGDQPFSEDTHIFNVDQDPATLHLTSTQQVQNLTASVEMISGEESVDSIELEDFEDIIPVDETNYIPVSSCVGGSAIQADTILEPNKIPLNNGDEMNSIPANVRQTNNILTDTMEITENILINSKEVADNTPTDNSQVDPSIFEIANNKDIPLNSIALMKDVEIPTDIHIIIPKPNEVESDENIPYSVTVKPLTGILKDAEEVPSTFGSNFQFDKDSVDALKVVSQFTVTERGCIQIIVSRYIYNSHHVARGGRKHRWRCSDYRKKKCPAFIDTLDNHIVLRKGIHNHPYHDDKIYKKHEKSQIYHSLKQAENARNNPSIVTVNPEDEDIAKLIDVKCVRKT